MMMARRITALALMDVVGSVLVLRIPYAWSYILLGVAYLAHEKHEEPFLNHDEARQAQYALRL